MPGGRRSVDFDFLAQAGTKWVWGHCGGSSGEPDSGLGAWQEPFLLVSIYPPWASFCRLWI